MVPAAVRHHSATDGLHPLRLARDWRQVLALIELAFGEDLDIEARRALHSMRPPPLLSPLIGLIDSLSLPGEGMMPGFVWRDGGRVVGTASVRRIHTFRFGWLISNVAVHPDWQGRGIGRALMEAALDYARDNGASWVVLQVRDDNRVARQLYESMGFRSVGEVVRLRKVQAGAVRGAVPALALRPARWSDGSALSRAARRLTPHDVIWPDNWNRDLYKTGRWDRLLDRLKGQYHQWWLHAEPGQERTVSGSQLTAAVGIEIDPRNPWHRLRLIIPPEAQSAGLADSLITFGLAQLADAAPLPIEIEHPAADAATQTALADAGFERLYALMHMRLDIE